MPQPRLRLKEKIILSFLSVILTSLFLSLTFSFLIFVLNLHRTLNPSLIESSEVLQSRITEIKERTLIFADIITRDETLVLYLKGEKTRSETIDTLIRLNSKIGLDILHVIDEEGRVLIRLDNLGKSGDMKENDPTLDRALRGIKVSTFKEEGGKFSIVASVPIQEQGKIYGVLLTGFEVSNALLNKVIGSLNEEISVFGTDGNLIATTLTDKNGAPYINQFMEADSIRGLDNPNRVPILQEKVGDETFRLLYSPLRDFDGHTVAYIMTALPTSQIMRNNTLTIIALVFSNLITILLAYIVASVNAKRLIEPILTIKKGTDIIGAGNLDYKISLNTNDETKDLADSFNSMGSKLKELLSEVSEENNKIVAERNKFSVVLEGVQDGIITLDFERKITLANKAACEIVGLTEEELLGKPCDEILIIFRNKVRISASDFCPLTPVDKGQIIFSDKNLKLVTPKKETYVSMTSAVIKNSKIANLGCILTFRDSTRERELEEMKLDFVSMAAHELRTPLTSIRGYLSVLEQGILDKITDEQKQYLDRITISSNQLTSLVENLLDVSKIEHNSLELDLNKVDWPVVIKTIISDFKQLADQKRIELKFNEPEIPLPPVQVDRFRIAEVLSNLIANALNYTGEGGKVIVSAQEVDGMVHTSIADTGCGIPDRSIPHLFTKFYRVSGTLEQGAKGTGLGLFISKSIVNKHKGEIWVESRVGIGSTFTFSVPVYKEEKTRESSA